MVHQDSKPLSMANLEIMCNIICFPKKEQQVKPPLISSYLLLSLLIIVQPVDPLSERHMESIFAWSPDSNQKKNKPGLHIPCTIWCSMIYSIGHPSDRSYHLFTKCTLNILQWQSEFGTLYPWICSRDHHTRVFLFAVIQFNVSMLAACREAVTP